MQWPVLELFYKGPFFLLAFGVEDLEVSLEREKGSDGTPWSEERFDKLDVSHLRHTEIPPSYCTRHIV